MKSIINYLNSIRSVKLVTPKKDEISGMGFLIANEADELIIVVGKMAFKFEIEFKPEAPNET